MAYIGGVKRYGWREKIFWDDSKALALDNFESVLNFKIRCTQL
jgi:hypothetical protein